VGVRLGQPEEPPELAGDVFVKELFWREWARRSESDPFAARKVIHLGA
jgi:hypothetical protein